MSGLRLSSLAVGLAFWLFQLGGMNANRVLHGRVWAENTAVGGVNISLRTESGEIISQTVSDADGHFSFRGLPSGHYLVSARLHGYRHIQQDVDLASVNTAMATLILQPRPRLLQRGAPLGRYSLATKAQKAYKDGLQLYQARHLRKSAAEFEQVVAAAPGFAPGYDLLGSIYDRMHKQKTARIEWRKALQLDPALISPAINLARYDNDKKHWARAMRHLHRPKPAAGPATTPARASVAGAKPGKKSPALPWQWYWELGRAEYGEKHLRRAHTALIQAENGGATVPNLHLLLANLAVRAGDYPHARHEFELYVQAAPKGRFAARARAIIRDMIAHHIPEPAG